MGLDSGSRSGNLHRILSCENLLRFFYRLSWRDRRRDGNRLGISLPIRFSVGSDGRGNSCGSGIAGRGNGDGSPIDGSDFNLANGGRSSGNTNRA